MFEDILYLTNLFGHFFTCKGMQWILGHAEIFLVTWQGKSKLQRVRQLDKSYIGVYTTLSLNGSVPSS